MDFKIKGCVPKLTFAKMYMRPETFTRPVDAFARMLRENKKVMCDLMEAGYEPSQKTFTPKQAQIVIDNFGMPDVDSPETQKYFQ